MKQIQKGINNKSSMHLCGAAEETQFKPSIMVKHVFCFKLQGNIEEQNQMNISHDVLIWCVHQQIELYLHIW